MPNNLYKVLIPLLVLLNACVKDHPPGKTDTSTTIKKGVFVLCEGQYTVGNASVYLYQPAKDSVYGDLYKEANHAGIGDVLQSMLKVDEGMVFCVNNSNKVILTNNDLAVQKSIRVPFPRYAVQCSNNIYVSTLYSNKVYILAASQFALKDSVTLPSLNAERMLVVDKQIFITTWDTSVRSIYRVDDQTHKVTQIIQIDGAASHDIERDKDGMLWVLSGNMAKQKASVLSRIDPSTGKVLSSLYFPASAEPIKLCMNAAKDTLYFIAVNYAGAASWNGIYRLSIYSTTLPEKPLIPAAQYQYFWGLAVEKGTGNIYVGDPKGFNQAGSVHIYNSNGTLLKTFVTGVGPSAFYFY